MKQILYRFLHAMASAAIDYFGLSGGGHELDADVEAL